MSSILNVSETPIPTPRPSFVLGQSQARAMFEIELQQRHLEICGMVRTACNLTLVDWPENRLDTDTRLGVKQSLDASLQSFEDIVAFLTLRHTVTPDFHEFPAVKKFLLQRDLPLTGRIELMFLKLPVVIWGIIARRSRAAS